MLVAVFGYRTVEFYSRGSMSSFFGQEVVYSAKNVSHINKSEEFLVQARIEAGANLDILSESSGKINNILIKKYEYVKKDQKLAEVNEIIGDIESDAEKVNIPDIVTDIDSAYAKKIGKKKKNKRDFKDMTRRYIISPCNGYIKDIVQENGAMLNFGITGGTKFASIACTDKLFASGSISTKNAKNIKKGMSVEIKSETAKAKSEISSISKIVGESGSVAFRVRLSSKDLENFFIDEVVDIKIIGKSEKLYSVPLSALVVDKSGDSFVWTIDKESNAKKVKVSVKHSDLDNVYVLGLKDGDLIITKGVNLVISDSKIKYEIS
ncbi:efflux RND transporter periplasmic adaptor subunit [Candidatus Deianiraea vastatrix]|uniref:efflux RND transporter periplasmic adaptor subunit n=1 Tax=Candidatus Deianiraea vastatrix TaxID=2163644 RepID=UPI001CA3C629|nr:HlyD family efflux transporter periplasmic adaptor subunit [Candidatus Deianiraea vastatrix]